MDWSEKHSGQDEREAPLRRKLVMILVAGVTGLLVTLAVQTRYLVPVENELTSQDVKFITERIDSMIKLRSFLVIAAAGKANLEVFLEKGGLERLSSTIRESFPDFLSLEVVNDRGEVLGMIGDLNLQPLSSKTRGGTFIQLSNAINFYNSTFSDDPATKSFMITSRHFAADRGVWYTRCRFARDEIENLLNSFKNEKVSLVPIWGGGINPGMLENFTNHAQEPVLSGSPWSSVSKGEMLLQSPGWMVRVERPRGGFLSPTSILVGLVGLACLCSLPLLKRFRQFFAAVREGLASKKGSYSPESAKSSVNVGPDVSERLRSPRPGAFADAPVAHPEPSSENPEKITPAAKHAEKACTAPQAPQVVFIQETDSGEVHEEKPEHQPVDLSETVEITHSELLSPVVIVEEDERRDNGEVIAAGEAAKEFQAVVSADLSGEPTPDVASTKFLNNEDADGCYAVSCNTDDSGDRQSVIASETAVAESEQETALLLLPPGRSSEAGVRSDAKDLPDTLELIWEEPAEPDAEAEKAPKDSVRFSEFFTC